MSETKSRVSFRTYWTLLSRYLSDQRLLVLLLSLLVLGGITLQLISPLLVRRFLDGVESGKDFSQLVRTALLFITLALLAQGLKVCASYAGERIAWTATNELRADLALHCLRLDMTFHKAHKPGELIERVDGDVNQLATFFSQLVIQLASNFLLIAGVLVLLWLVDWRVGLTITLLSLLGLALLNWMNGYLVPRWQRVRQVDSDLFGYLEEWLNDTEEIQTNGAAPYVLGRLYRLFRSRWDSMHRAMRLNLGVIYLPIVLPTLAYIAAYVWGASLYAGELLTIGTIFLIFYYIDLIKNPLWVIQRQVQDLQKASAGINRISQLFAQEPAIRDISSKQLPAAPLNLQFTAVSFYYADDPQTNVLEDIEFTLEKGHVLGLLGRTGSGKTTLSRLLFRFYDPTSGAIKFQDDAGLAYDLRDIPRSELRRHIGLVTQEVQLFHASIRDNLTLFDDTLADAQLLDALDSLGLRQWVENLPQGLATHIEGNESLSAGEAQLLAMARVFLTDPALVVLDEASSRLDPATESLLEQAVAQLLHGRSAIIIAHRLKTVQRADEIMILSDGRILEYGPRLSLQADPGSRYANLLRAGLEEMLV